MIDFLKDALLIINSNERCFNEDNVSFLKLQKVCFNKIILQIIILILLQNLSKKTHKKLLKLFMSKPASESQVFIELYLGFKYSGIKILLELHKQTEC